VATLYRQYRPTNFKEIVGQEHVTETLQAAIKKKKLTHAYLFHGPRGTGKTTTARILAKRVNCQGAKGTEPCGRCRTCKASVAGSNIDLIEIDAASNRGIDDIRALRERISSAPSIGEYKIYIIDEVHMLTAEAASALLKTLEEPVKHAIFILATTELHKVLPTTLSRCQVYRFRRATDQELLSRLKYLLKKEKRVAEDEVLEFIISRSDGCYRDAESLLDQLLTMQAKKLTKDSLISLLGLPPRELLDQFLTSMNAAESGPAIGAVDQAFAEGFDPEQFLRESILEARDRAVKDGSGEGRWPVVVRALLQAMQDLAYVPQPMVALHLAILTVCTKKGDAPKKETVIQDRVKRETTKREQPVTSKEQEQEQEQTKSSDIQLDDVKKIWPSLINKVKDSNPVASTFLRAIEPLAVGDDVVSMRTRYSLHKNFFDNPKHKAMVEKLMSELLEHKITTKFVLDEEGPANGQTLAEQRKSSEDQFYETVKEVFG